MFYLVIWLPISVPFLIPFHHINIILKYLYIKEDKHLESLKQVYYPIIKDYILIQIYFFSLKLKCALNIPPVHFPKNACVSEKWSYRIKICSFILRYYYNILQVIVIMLILWLNTEV